MTLLWTFLVSVVFRPLWAISLTVTYYDLCVREEALDVTLMMEQAGMSTQPPQFPSMAVYTPAGVAEQRPETASERALELQTTQAGGRSSENAP